MPADQGFQMFGGQRYLSLNGHWLWLRTASSPCVSCTVCAASAGGLELWYNSYTKMRFDRRKSKRLRANSSGGSGLKRHKKSFLIPTTLTSALTCRSSTELSAGWEQNCTRSSLRCGKTRKESITTS